ncbi:MAG: ABC transporter permease [Candidatus Humimicrobiaceae bacterium]
MNPNIKELWGKFQNNAFFNYFYITVFLILLLIATAIFSPILFTSFTIMNILEYSMAVGIIAIGQTIVIIEGGIDLSSGSVVACVGMLVVAFYKNFGLDISFTLPLSLLFGAGIGYLNGFIIVKLKVPPIIATLGMMSLLRGAVNLYSSGVTKSGVGSLASAIGSYKFGPMPLTVFVMLVLYIITHFILSSSKFGRAIYLVGANKKAAYFSGLKVNQIEMGVYILSGIFAAIVGFLLVTYTGSISPGSVGSGMEFLSIAAVIIGGSRLGGGNGNLLQTFLGILALGLIYNLLSRVGISSYTHEVIAGLLILVIVWIGKRRELRELGK